MHYITSQNEKENETRKKDIQGTKAKRGLKIRKFSKRKHRTKEEKERKTSGEKRKESKGRRNRNSRQRSKERQKEIKQTRR
jgi:hypothetical protein